MVEIIKVERKDWDNLSGFAHLTVFNEKRDSSFDRCDYALLAEEKDTLIGYVTVRELDAESAYWQFGGAFPPGVKSHKIVEAHLLGVHYMSSRYKRITTLIENDNYACLKLSFHHGFKIIGCRMFGGQVLVELLNDFGGDK